MFAEDTLTGFFDFYFAGVDTWLFDLAVCLNDWCIDLPTGAHHAERAAAMLTAYQSVRQLTAAERELLSAMLRGRPALWISRLWDFFPAARGVDAQAARPHAFRAGLARPHCQPLARLRRSTCRCRQLCKPGVCRAAPGGCVRTAHSPSP